MSRLHLFEFEDFSWFPTSIRNYMTDTLQFFVCLFKSFDAAAPILDSLIQKSQCTTIVDLCSGGSGPLLAIYKQIGEKTEKRPTIILTDKFPNLLKFDSIKQQSGGAITYLADSVDATSVPATLSGIRTMFSSFHHFKPEDAKRILVDAYEKKHPVAIFEVVDRRLSSLITLIPFSLLTFVFTPFIKPFKWQRLIWTYLIPAVPFFILFDGMVSALRSYSQDELKQMIQELPQADYRWETGIVKRGRFFNTMTYLTGYPTLDRTC